MKDAGVGVVDEDEDEDEDDCIFDDLTMKRESICLLA